MREFIIRADNNKFTFEGEVVHCQDCEFCMVEETISRGIIPDMYCRIWQSCVSTDDYCSYGERKEEKQVTGKLENAENVTSEGDESTTGQPKIKLYIPLNKYTVDRVNQLLKNECGEYFDEEWLYNELEQIAERIQLSPETSTTSKTETVDTDLISRQAAIDAVEKAVFKGVAKSAIESLPPVTPKEQNEEDILKFYYVESLDEYWIGQRCGTRYYGKWTGNCFTFGYSRYLPWGEHVVAPDTLWKEHTYPSEPKEIPFNEWLQGFLQRECRTERPKGEWIVHSLVDDGMVELECPECGDTFVRGVDYRPHFCENCGCRMTGDDGNDNE